MIDTKLFDFTNECTPKCYQSLGLDCKNFSGCIVSSTGADNALLNGVIKSSFQGDVEQTVNQVIQHFQQRNIPHSWWVETSNEPPELKNVLESQGFQLFGVCPGMAINIQNIQQPSANTEIKVKTITSDKELIEWGDVISKSFGFSQESSDAWTALFRKAGLNGPFYHVIGERNGKVVTTGSILCSEQGAYIYNIATVEEERKKGYASQISYELLQIAKNHHLKYAALVSSPLATHLYEKLGFEHICDYNIYVETT